QQNALPSSEPSGISPNNGQRRDVVQRGRDGKNEGCMSLAEAHAGRTLPQLFDIFQRNHVFFVERTDQQAPEGRDMTTGAKPPAEVTGEGPHIGALAAFGLKHNPVGIRALEDVEPMDVNRAGLQLDGLAVASEIIGSFAADLDRRKFWWHLQDCAAERT